MQRSNLLGFRRHRKSRERFFLLPTVTKSLSLVVESIHSRCVGSGGYAKCDKLFWAVGGPAGDILMGGKKLAASCSCIVNDEVI